MSENKCPCCGCPMVEKYLGWVCPADNCAFRCSTNSLPRIAAAMKAEARHNALVEAVAWEREFDEALVWLVQTGRYPMDMAGKYDLANEREAARAEVDRLIGEGEE